MNSYNINMLLDLVGAMREPFDMINSVDELDGEELAEKLEEFAEECKKLGGYAYIESIENNMFVSLAAGADAVKDLIGHVGFQNDDEALLANAAKGFLAYAARVLECEAWVIR